MKTDDWASFVAGIESIPEWEPQTATKPPAQFTALVQGRLSSALRSGGEDVVQLFDYVDTYIITANTLAASIQETIDKESSSVQAAKLANILFQLPLPSKVDYKRTLLSFAGASKKLRKVCVSTKAAQKAFSRLWIAFLQLPMDNDLMAKCVEVAGGSVMRELEEPTLLCDFFICAFAQPHPLNVAALRGIFTLITKHDLNYPDIFSEVYGLLQPEALFVSHPEELLELVALFLSSTHLPAYTVAAFVKRLARLSLLAPPNIAPWILGCLQNLLARHKSLKPMRDKTAGLSEAPTDPFLDSAKDPLAANALESALWEIKTMRSHWAPFVSAKASFIGEKNLEENKLEWTDEEDQWAELCDLEPFTEDNPVPLNNRPMEDLFVPSVPSLTWS